MGKILCLDLGDVWIGIAISDPSWIVAKPLTTVKREELKEKLQALFVQEEIETVVVGYPKTMRGTISQQTQKILDQEADLKKTFPKKKWVLWDERLSSKQAEKLKKAKTKEEKIKSHAMAAAFILDTYLHFLNA